VVIFSAVLCEQHQKKANIKTHQQHPKSLLISPTLGKRVENISKSLRELVVESNGPIEWNYLFKSQEEIEGVLRQLFDRVLTNGWII
jgi:hypothetical protein